MVRKANDLGDFQGILKEAGNRLMVVDFYSKQCSPKFEEASKNPKYKNVIFVKVDVDEADKIASACGVKGTASFQFYKNGKMVDQFSGEKPDVLAKKLDTHKT
ncbi:thioredoxin-like [Halichoeres trimaculatus]|uniref:thioredoxin-like n=1 Tax=Halichoeres trimaculatus TaxID=147232 RepID=UPI003D9F4EBA